MSFGESTNGSSISSISLGKSLVHLEYSALYLISCRDSGKPTETNLDIHRFRYLVYCERGTKNGTVIPGSQKIGPLLYPTEGLVITKKNVDW